MQHGDNACTMVASVVTPMGSAEFADLVENDAKVRRRQAQAIDRELDARKEFLAHRNRDNPVARMAAFLLSIASQNANDGLDPAVVNDSLSCGTVSNYLGLDIEVLGKSLVELERSGLIEQFPPSKLRLTDMAGLERLSNGKG